MNEDIPPVTQEYLNRHPELEAQGVKVGDPLPDAPQPMIRETVDKEVLSNDEPKINAPVENALNSEGAMEDIKKSRDGQFMVYTIRRSNLPDEVVQTIAGSQQDIDMDLRMNNSLPKSAEVAEQLGGFKVLDQTGRMVRVYTNEIHGENAEQLAEQFAQKNNYILKK